MGAAARFAPGEQNCSGVGDSATPDDFLPRSGRHHGGDWQWRKALPTRFARSGARTGFDEFRASKIMLDRARNTKIRFSPTTSVVWGHQ